jgi:valyl-tRNA synthetase
MGLKFRADVPFRTVYIHALVRDAEGRKMSKSVGNVIDPLEMMDRYGTDAFRFTLAAFAAMGRDIKLAAGRIEGYRNFANKIWNAARFVQMHLQGPGGAPAPTAFAIGLAHDLDRSIGLDDPDWRARLGLADRWILSRTERLVADVRQALDAFEFNTAAARLYEFVWHEYCDWYLELSKLALAGGDTGRADAARTVLVTVLERILRLLHPIMPFITEELWQSLPAWVRAGGEGEPSEHLVVAAFPRPREARVDASAEASMERIIAIVRAVRNLRAEVGLAPGQRVGLRVYAADAGARAEIGVNRASIEALARVDGLELLTAPSRPRDSVLVALDGMELYVPVLGLIDVAAERLRLEKEMEKVAGELAAVRGKLANTQFVERAPVEIVEKERDREASLQERRATLERGMDRLRQLGTAS